MNPTMAPYTPSLYLPGSAGRYRRYPHTVQTPIPGAGYDAQQLVWAEQELNLDGPPPGQNYGDYESVPLRGMGAISPLALTTFRASTPLILPPVAPPPQEGGFVPPAVSPQEEAEAVQRMLEESQRTASAPPSTSFFQKKIGPVPVWAAGAAGILALGGAVWMMRRKKKVSPNRRRRRSRR